MPVSIRIAGNTTIPTLLAIKAKGYKITSFYTETGNKLLGSDTAELQSTYEAEKDDCCFSATCPEELLGLITMWEIRGDNWRDYRDSDDWEIYDRLIKESPVYDSEGNIVGDD